MWYLEGIKIFIPFVMRGSSYFLNLTKEDPKEAQIASHRLMLRSCLVQRIAPGIYAWLPLGLRVLQKISAIVRQEQNRVGAVEVLAPTLQPSELWQESGRYDDYGQELLRFLDRHEKELLYGPTAEEVFTFLFRQHIKSYRQLPQMLYNIQWKFRDEIRPRFGVMRGREFLMKDTYSFDLTPEDANKSYEKMFSAYMATFRRLGLRAIPLRADTGPIGGDLSHEFHVMANTGESALYYDEALDAVLDKKGPINLQDVESFYAMADEKHNPHTCPIPKERLKENRGIEVGHIFYFGTKYSRPLKAFVSGPKGEDICVEMGSYGIGVSRLVGALIEAFHDDKGIRWPLGVSPFSMVVTSLKHQGPEKEGAEEFYKCWTEREKQRLGATQFHDVGPHHRDLLFYDLPQQSPGEILNSLDLLGFPYQIIFGKHWTSEGKVEIKHRLTSESVCLTLEESYDYLEKIFKDHEKNQ